MTISDWLMIGAVLLAPLVAVQVQKYIEVSREKRQRKMNTFHTLMATRAARLSPAHVQALNMIDIEFYGKKFLGMRYQGKTEKRVSETWKSYLDHLNRPFDNEGFREWVSKGDELFTELLYEMPLALKYDFDKVHLRRGIYAPKAHNDQEIAQLANPRQSCQNSCRREGSSNGGCVLPYVSRGSR